VQRYLKEKKRCWESTMFMESLHGFMEDGAPASRSARIGEHWDPELVHQVLRLRGDEAGAARGGQVFSPARAPIWRAILVGRTEETTARILIWCREWPWPPITGVQVTP